MFETDLLGRLVSADESFRALALSGGAVPIGAAPWANAHPGDRAAAELAWSRLREAGEPLTTSFRVWTQHGKLVWLRLDATAKKDLFAQHVGYIGCVTDVTEEQHQRQLSERLTGLLGVSPDAILIIDRQIGRAHV